MSKLTTTINGLKLKTPLLLASGVLGITANLLGKVAKAGAGAVVTKSIGPNPKLGHPGPNVVGVKGGMLNAMGLPNPGVDAFVQEIQAYKKMNLSTPLIGSIFGSTTVEYVNVATAMEQAGVDVIELNVSCPHSTENVLNIGLDAKLCEGVVASVKRAITKPLWIKIPCNTNIPSLIAVVEGVERSGVDALVVSNTLPAMAIDVTTQQPILGNKIGGLSGSALKPVSLRLVYELFQKTSKPIIGAGGVNTWKDVVEYLLAGAVAVQIGTAVAQQTEQVFQTISSNLNRYLTKNQISNVQDLVGLSHQE
ncbi:MAG: dihydroorotate dehydrogenase [Candidatus Ranarchaeia archaeon]|jgi:dihydroorotate dehydrogenase (NAD+) catalytic subunit